jgi:peptidoglycan hydrolase-like protein with peptidoglycan-binding domain
LDASLNPHRVAQIQEALIRAGCLTGPPNGVWDAATDDAMRHYQATNGFDMTGLPEAKPLMKLGLGPHPLPRGVPAATPADVDPNPPADIPNAGGAGQAISNSTHR